MLGIDCCGPEPTGDSDEEYVPVLFRGQCGVNEGRSLSPMRHGLLVKAGSDMPTTIDCMSVEAHPEWTSRSSCNASGRL